MTAKTRIRAKCPCASTATRTAGSRSTSAPIAFTADDRIIGDAVKNKTATNVKNAVFGGKRMVGGRFSDRCPG